MMNLKYGLIGAAVLASALAGEARAQFMDMSGMITQNLMFDQMMEQQAAQIARQWYEDVQAYRRATGDYTTPALSGFNAHTLSQANRETSQAYDAYNQSWHQNSQAMGAAVSRTASRRSSVSRPTSIRTARPTPCRTAPTTTGRTCRATPTAPTLTRRLTTRTGTTCSSPWTDKPSAARSAGAGRAGPAPADNRD